MRCAFPPYTLLAWRWGCGASCGKSQAWAAASGKVPKPAAVCPLAGPLYRANMPGTYDRIADLGLSLERSTR
jgi:hypothetical protein